jgi:hypothetical protein
MDTDIAFALARRKGRIELPDGKWLCSQEAMRRYLKHFSKLDVRRSIDVSLGTCWLFDDKAGTILPINDSLDHDLFESCY